jgi:hypothetical protein
MKKFIQTVRDRKENGDAASSLIIGIAIIGIVALLGQMIISRVSNKAKTIAAVLKDTNAQVEADAKSSLASKSPTDEPEAFWKTPETTQSPTNAATVPNVSGKSSAVDIPWETISLVALGVIALFIAIIVLRTIIKSHGKRQRIYTSNMSQWDALFAKHRDVKTAWADYEMDINKVIDYPAMTDTTDPVTLTLHKALERASLLQPRADKSLRASPAVDTSYAEAVNDLHRAFTEAEKNAKKVAWSGFTDQERRQLSQAKDLLAMAYNTSASPSERQSAYKQAMKRLEGLIVPPQQALLAIEQRMPILIEQ